MTFVLPDEERFAEFLRSALQDVHTPIPPAPREEMWAGMMEMRRGSQLSAEARSVHAVPRDRAPIAPVSPRAFARMGSAFEAPAYSVQANPAANLTPNRRIGFSARWTLPIAAAALMVGVGVGLQFEQAQGPNETATIVTAPERLEPEVAAQVAADQHLAEVQQLVSYFNSIESGAAAENNALAEAQVAAWARDLLATTQLLIDSPLGMDMQRRNLLAQVEMVLVQIAQLGPDALSADREITEQSIEQSQVMEHLQQATPMSPQAPKTAKGAAEVPKGL